MPTAPGSRAASSPLANVIPGAAALGLGVISALAGHFLAQGAGLAIGYVVLFEPVAAAAALSWRGRAIHAPSALAAASGLLALDRTRFRTAGWTGAAGLSFTLSGLAAAKDPYDAVATWLFLGIFFMFVSGAPIAILDRGLAWQETWGALRQWARTATAREDPPPPTLPEPGERAHGGFEAVMKARWEEHRQCEAERLARSPLTSVEGWEALKRQPSAPPDPPEGAPRSPQ